MNEIVRDYFNALTQVRRGSAARREPDVIHGRLCGFLERSMRNAEEAGWAGQDVRDLGYVLAALGDEVALSVDAELRDYWIPRLLQLKYFNENTAGEGVFQRIDTLLAEPHRSKVLHGYYLCLAFGFQGKFRIRGGEAQLDSVTERVFAALRSQGIVRESELSPNGQRPRGENTKARQRLPLIAASVAILVVSLLVYAGFRLSVGGDTDTVLQTLNAASE